jgi:hypothetical protein
MRKIKNFAGIVCLLLIGLTAGYAGSLEPVKYKDRTELQVKVADIYTAQIGVREKTGHNDGVMVEKYLAVTGFTKGAPWCASFVSWTYKQADVPAIKNAWSPSWFPPDKTIYTKGVTNKVKPEKADVFGIYFPNLKRVGHVGFIDDWPEGNYAITVEGNTNNAGSREGDGVYRKRRLKDNIFKVSRWIDYKQKVAYLPPNKSVGERLTRAA